MQKILPPHQTNPNFLRPLHSTCPRTAPPVSLKQHYSTPALLQRISASLPASVDRSTCTSKDLAGSDQFHIGGAKSALKLFSKLELAPGDVVLDAGCGLGGPARTASAEFGCEVRGVDLSQEYVECGNELSSWPQIEESLRGKVALTAGDATSMPVADESVDKGYMLHVGMNIEDKEGLAREMFRVLRGGGVFGIFDMVAPGGRAGGNRGALRLPLPFASEPEHAFLESPEYYIEAFTTGAGFVLLDAECMTSYCVDAIRKRAGKKGGRGGPGIVMGEDVGQKMKNVLEMFEAGEMHAHMLVFGKVNSEG